MNEHMFSVSQSGFKLSNGYLMTQDTFRLVGLIFLIINFYTNLF